MLNFQNIFKMFVNEAIVKNQSIKTYSKINYMKTKLINILNSLLSNFFDNLPLSML